MTLRTLRDAQETLDRLACSIETRRQLQAVLDAEKARRIEELREATDRDLAHHGTEVEKVERELKALAKSFTDLTAEAERGHITAREYGDKLDELRAERDRISQRATSLDASIEPLELAEAEPTTTLQSLQERYPVFRVNVPW